MPNTDSTIECGVMAAPDIITVERVLEHSDDDSIDGTRQVSTIHARGILAIHAAQLIIRGQGFNSFDPGAIRRLSQLEMLSLSHNAFDRLRGFEQLTNLIEVSIACCCTASQVTICSLT